MSFAIKFSLFVLVCLTIIAIDETNALRCRRCNHKQKLLCRKPKGCKGGLTKGICGCCSVCAKQDGEKCGGLWNMRGRCDQGLTCKSVAQKFHSRRAGVCVPNDKPKECKGIAACRKGCRYGFLPPRKGSCFTCSCRSAPKLISQSCGGQYNMLGRCTTGLHCVNNVCIQKIKKAQICGPICLIYCRHGNVLDSRGCPTCTCKTSPERIFDVSSFE